jgi:hypothetical protein
MSVRHIYVMRERWVVTGIPSPTDNPLFLSLSQCASIRVWGTTAGLGQLAREGPTDDTKFDPEPDGTRINLLDVMRDIPCQEGREWKLK